ncbi:hypothetical protein FRB93_011060 [Tulasnella sp. JGI-2019a]|nr:hypothetical protein FRB93_011060 [Tulasnella sp. JGI-2019a]
MSVSRNNASDGLASFDGMSLKSRALQPHLDPAFIPPGQVVIDDDTTLGGGDVSRSNSCRGVWRSRNAVVIMKRLPRETSRSSIIELVQRCQSLQHDNVQQVLGASATTSGSSCLVSPFFESGNVIQYMGKHPEVMPLKLVCEIAMGMEYLHSKNLIHGRLKPANVLINNQGQACITDYGLYQFNSMPVSAAYLSPEAWKGKISKSSDVYAFAIVMYEVYTLAPPWGFLPDSQIYQLVTRENERPDRPADDASHPITDPEWNIIKVSWDAIPSVRPTFTQIISSIMELGQSGLTASSYWAPTVQPIITASSSQGLQSQPAAHGAVVRNDTLSTPPPAYPGSPAPAGARGSAVSRPIAIRPRTSANPPATRTPLTPPASPPASSSSSPSPVPRIDALPAMDQIISHSSDRQAPHSAPFASSEFPHHSTQPPHGVPARSTSPQDASMRKPIFWRRSATGAVDASKPALHTSSILGLFGRKSSHREHDGTFSPPSTVSSGGKSPMNIALALHSEVTEGKNPEAIDHYLVMTRELIFMSEKEIPRLITAGIVPTLITLVKARSHDGVGIEVVLKTLGMLANDPLSSNTIFRTNTVDILLQIAETSPNQNAVNLTIWCLSRISRSADIATGLVKKGIMPLLLRKGLTGSATTAQYTSWCLGNLVYTESLADMLVNHRVVPALADHFRKTLDFGSSAQPDDLCAALYAIARISRSIKIAKLWHKSGFIQPLISSFLSSEDPDVLMWSARVIGCLMRPNSADMARILLEAGAAQGLARLPRVIPFEAILPLESFAFAIQRFSCAEWGSSTRQALVEAGVVDSLLAAVRTAADVPFPQVHTELALAVSLLGDVGGGDIRKEIVRAGGVDILKRVGENGSPKVAKACNMAVKSITGNILTRNAASAKTAMMHDWTGGCPDYQPSCPSTGDLGGLEAHPALIPSPSPFEI